MSALRSQYTISGDIRDVVQTGAADQHTLASAVPEGQEARSAWQALIDRQLIEWGRDARPLEDDGVVPPLPAVVNLASRLAMAMRDDGKPPPLRVVPNGEGGIVFERCAGSVFETVEIQADLSVESASYRDSRLVSRQRVL